MSELFGFKPRKIFRYLLRVLWIFINYEMLINNKLWPVKLSCQNEPETPCWQIAKRVESSHDVSNRCCDCIVYLFQNETSVIRK